jgi:Tfp pilus assembly protein FimT
MNEGGLTLFFMIFMFVGMIVLAVFAVPFISNIAEMQREQNFFEGMNPSVTNIGGQAYRLNLNQENASKDKGFDFNLSVHCEEIILAPGVSVSGNVWMVICDNVIQKVIYPDLN